MSAAVVKVKKNRKPLKGLSEERKIYKCLTKNYDKNYHGALSSFLKALHHDRKIYSKFLKKCNPLFCTILHHIAPFCTILLKF